MATLLKWMDRVMIKKINLFIFTVDERQIHCVEINITLSFCHRVSHILKK